MEKGSQLLGRSGLVRRARLRELTDTFGQVVSEVSEGDPRPLLRVCSDGGHRESVVHPQPEPDATELRENDDP